MSETLVRVVEEISRANGAAGWCTALGGEYGVFGGHLSADIAQPLPLSGALQLGEGDPAHLAVHQGQRPGWLIRSCMRS
jgi:hypothetical protein